MPERLRHNPILVLLAPLCLLVAGVIWADWNGMAMPASVGLFAALATAVAVLLCTVGGPFALVVFYLTMLGAASLLAWMGLGAAFGYSGGGGLLIACGIVVVAGFGLSMMRSPLRHRFEGEIVIERPRQQVWDALFLAPTTRHWKPHVRKVEAVPGREDVFAQHYFSGGDTDDDAAMPPTLIRRSAVTEGVSFTVETVPSEDQAGMPAHSDLQTYVLEDFGTGTRITSTEQIDNARLGLLIMAALVQPVQDELRQLKAVLEGTEDTTIASGFHDGDG